MELLQALVTRFTVAVSNVPEPTTDDAVHDAVVLARAKASAIASEPAYGRAIVIGADTIVHDGTRAYGKPADVTDAFAMLQALRGRTHQVVTGVAVVTRNRSVTAHSLSAVTLSDLTDAEVAAYVASGRPADKAGAYAIQDEDVPTVSHLTGCYCGVMGLPLWKLRELLLSCDVDCASPETTFSRCGDCPERPAVRIPRKSATIRQ